MLLLKYMLSFAVNIKASPMDIVSSIVAAELQAQSVRNSTGILTYTHIPIQLY